jgi:uncharacterized membrane protein
MIATHNLLDGIRPESLGRLGPLWMVLHVGLALTAGFVVLRAFNVYGDPFPWSPQRTGLLTALSFLNTTKYPPSLAFLLMTLGPAIASLAWFERLSGPVARFLIVFGRVPLPVTRRRSSHPMEECTCLTAFQ